MTDFTPETKLVMAERKMVLGSYLNEGDPLTITDHPAEPGQVDPATARLLVNKGVAIDPAEARPTPVETVEQEAARLTVPPAPVPQVPGDDDAQVITTQDDLNVWPEDNEERGVKAGDPVTNDDLRWIAEKEDVELRAGANKGEMQKAIQTQRAARAEELTD